MREFPMHEDKLRDLKSMGSAGSRPGGAEPMLMRTLLTVLILFLFVAPTLAQEAPKFSESQFRRAAASLFADPLGPNAESDCKTVLTWSVESPDVEVTIGPAILDVLKQGKNQEESSLLCAFAAGQSLAQLKNKVKGGYAVEGGLKLLEVYSKIRARNPKYTNPGAENLKTAEKNGALAEILETKK